jgi:hypothetical protein
MLQDVALFILSHSGLPWIHGENFFVGALPVKNVLGSPTPERTMVILGRVPAALVGELPDFRAKPIQVWNRNNTYLDAQADAEQIFAILHGASGWSLPAFVSGANYYAWTIDAVGDPAPLFNPDEKRLFEFSTNYLFRASIP